MTGLMLIILLGGGYGVYKVHAHYKKKQITSLMIQRYNQKIREQLNLRENDWYRIIEYKKIEDTLYHVQIEVSRFDGGVALAEVIGFTMLFKV